MQLTTDQLKLIQSSLLLAVNLLGIIQQADPNDPSIAETEKIISDEIRLRSAAREELSARAIGDIIPGTTGML